MDMEVEMEPAQKHTPEYVTDSEGHKKAVIIPIEEYQELLEDLADLAVVAERREEPSVRVRLRRDVYRD
jgi:hypothetical protein